MIIRPTDKGWIFITQPSHAWATEKMTRAWGNDQFIRPVLRDAFILGMLQHDIGWLPLDGAPRLNDDGTPANFVDMTLDELFPIWNEGVKEVFTMHPYAALLVSLHATTIYEDRLERGTDSPEAVERIQRELLDHHADYQARVIEQIKDHPVYGPETEESPLTATYRRLRACDLMALVMMTTLFADEGEIPDVPVTASDDRQTLHYRLVEEFVLEVDPYPFGEPGLVVPVDARQVDQKTFGDRAEYQAKLKEVDWVRLEFTIYPA